jgi:predicted ATPase
LFLPPYLSLLAKSYAGIGQLDEAWRSIGEAMAMIEATKERWHEAEVNRIAGEISLMQPEPDAAKAQNHFERALSVARQQQAKSW